MDKNLFNYSIRITPQGTYVWNQTPQKEKVSDWVEDTIDTYLQSTKDYAIANALLQKYRLTNNKN